MPPRRTFGRTWWGRAWLDALEGRAVHDPNRLPRGRTYARTARVDDLAVGPGTVRARVRGSRPEPYDVLLTVRTFRDDEWDCVLDAIVGRAAHAAALLDGELDPGVDADARAVEVELLPRSGELRTACSCPDWAEPCKHAAAVCYLVADALDDDPFALLLLRGLERDEVLAAVRERRSGGSAPTGASAAEPVVDDLGVPAREAWAAEPAALPHVPPPARGPGRPAAWPTDPPADAPFTAAGLRTLAADAARRAWALRSGTGGSGLDLDPVADLARRAAALDPDERRALAARAGTTDAALAAGAHAWSVAGAEGVALVHELEWAAPVAAVAAAREALLDTGLPARSVRARGNRVTVAGTEQLRLGRDGRWAHFTRRGGRWELAGPPVDDVDELVDAVASVAPPGGH